jgi:hypothetical protein
MLLIKITLRGCLQLAAAIAVSQQIPEDPDPEAFYFLFIYLFLFFLCVLSTVLIFVVITRCDLPSQVKFRLSCTLVMGEDNAC